MFNCRTLLPRLPSLSLAFRRVATPLPSCRLLSTTKNDSPPKPPSAEQKEASMWDSEDLLEIFDNNRTWQKQMLSKDPSYFRNLKDGQKPKYLLIGCSDSRVGAQEIMGLNQGELFVHRNIANMVVSTDLNILSVLFYSVNVLKVTDILVLGHYECGGVRAASENADLGLIEHWLRNIRDVQRLHKDELEALEDPEARHRRLVELNVEEQCINLFGNSIVQQMQAKTGRPRIHGIVYDIENGLLKKLDIDFRSLLRKYRDIYTVADFRHYAPIDIADLESKSGEEENKAEEDDIPRLIFGQIDTDNTGFIRKEQIKSAMKRFGNHDMTELELEEAMNPLLGMDRDHIDLTAFREIFNVLQQDGDDVEDDTLIPSDRLVVIRRSGGEYPPHPLRCSASTTVLDLKEAVSTLTGIPTDQQRLFHDGGYELRHDHADLAEVGISDIAEVELRVEIVPEAFKRPQA